MQLYITDREHELFFVSKMLKEMKMNLHESKEHFFIGECDLLDVGDYMPDQKFAYDKRTRNEVRLSWHGSVVNSINPRMVKRECYSLLSRSFV